jgi:hypothetical protein
MFDSLTTDERRELHIKLSSALNKFSTVTLCLGRVSLDTEETLGDIGWSLWQARAHFKDAGDEIFTIVMDDITL